MTELAMASYNPESPLCPSTTATESNESSKRAGGVFSKPSFVTQMQKHKVRTVKTLCLYLAYTALGMATGMSGPTILDLQLTVDSTYEQITFILPGRSLGYALGSFFGEYFILFNSPITPEQHSYSWIDLLFDQHSTFDFDMLWILGRFSCYPPIQSYSVRFNWNIFCQWSR